MLQTEYRAVVAELRAKDKPEGEAGLPVIEGYAAVFDSRSSDLGGFVEVIKPGAFDRALKEKHDVRALVNHNPDRLLGRSKAGTLELEVDERGLLVRIHPPDTQDGRDTVTSIKRGDMDGMSFGFRVLTDEWRMDEGVAVRDLIDVELVDVSPVTYPAYSATQVSTRALEQAREVATPRPEPGVPNEVNEARLRLS